MFKWDDAKDASNIAKHGLSFRKASLIFDGPIVTAIDDRFDYGEVRRISIGTIGAAVVIVVTHADRNGKIRIISARPAKRQEARGKRQEARKGTVCRRTTQKNLT